MIDRPSASSARARALTSNALSVPIVCMRAAICSRDAVAIIESPVAREGEHHLRRSASSRPTERRTHTPARRPVSAS